jgi:hypothetical protein
VRGVADQRHLIDDEALVYCPIRTRMVDIEGCLGCDRLVDYDLDARRPYLICRGPEDGQPDPAR